MKYSWAAVLVSMICAFSSEPCQWDQYLGNPGRTAYTTCNGPDSPEILWEISLEGNIGDPFIVGEKIVVLCETPLTNPFPSSVKTNIAVIDLYTGSLLQKIVFDLAGAYPVGEDRVFGQSGDEFYEIDLLSEKISLVSELPLKYFCDPFCYPCIIEDKIVVPSTPVVCLSKNDYNVLWDLQSSLGSLYPENGRTRNIAASTDRVYIVLEEGEEKKIWAVDSETGKSIWVSDALNILYISTDGSSVFAGGKNLYALDAETGELLWTFESDYVFSNIVVGSDAVYFTDNTKLYAVDKMRGHLRWEAQWEGLPIWMTSIVGTEDTIICSDVLNMSSFSREDGKKLWNVHFQDYIELSPYKPCPAVAEGIIIVRGKEPSGNLIALASDPELFVKQGDAFLEKGESEKALTSYKKAQELYEKKGSSKAQEVQKKIQELEKSPPSTPAQSEVPEPPISPPPVQFNPLILLSAVAVVILAGILLTYYLFVKKTRNK